MPKYFEINPRSGSWQDTMGRTVTVTGSPEIKRGEKGMAIQNTWTQGLTYSSQILPNNAFTIVVYVKRTKGGNYDYDSLISNGTNPSCNLYISDAAYGDLGLYLGVNNRRNWISTPLFDWICLIITCPGSAQSDISSSVAYINGVQLTVKSTDATGTQVSRSTTTMLLSTSSASIKHLAYLATYDHVFTEAERASTLRDFNNSYPIVKEKYPNFISKPMDLSREVNNTLGAELVTNGGFDSDTGWTKGTGTTISNSKLNADGSVNSVYGIIAYQQSGVNSFWNGKRVLITVTISNYVSGNLRICPGNTTMTANPISSNGVFTEILNITNGDDYLYLLNNLSGVFVGSIDDISIKEVTGLVAAYNMIPNGSTLVDISGNGKNGTITKCIENKNGLNILPYGGVSTALHITESGTYTLSCRCRKITASSALYILTQRTGGGGGITFYIGNGIIGLTYFSVAAYDITLSSVNNTEWHSVSFVKSTNVCNVYYDGINVGTLNLGTPIASLNNAFLLCLTDGTNINSTNPSECSDLRIYNRALSEQECKNYHNSFVKPYLVEDFSSEGADGIAKVPSGWVKQSGSFCINELTAQDSILKHLDKGTHYMSCLTPGVIALPSKQAYGEYRKVVYKGADANVQDWLFAVNKPQNATYATQNGYLVRFGSDEKLYLYKTVNGSLTALITSSGTYSITTYYEVKVTRTTAGVFTLYVRGGAVGNVFTSIGTATDTTFSSCDYMAMDNDAADRDAEIYLLDGIKQ